MRTSTLCLLLGTASIWCTPASSAEAPHLVHLPGKHLTAHTIALEADVPCSPDESYKLWSTESGVERFFAPSATIDDQVGGRYAVAFFPKDDPKGLVHGTAGAHLLAANPGRFIAFEWIVFAGDNKRGHSAPPYAPPEIRLPSRLPTWVEIGFQPTKDGATHVHFRHYGFADGELWGQSQAWFTQAWSGVLSQMRTTCLDMKRQS